MDLNILESQPRLLIEVDLQPVQGSRFQPTGFADLGAAEFTMPDNTSTVLVESAQSVANRLEAAIWDEARQDVVEPLKGLPFVKTTTQAGHETNSLLEAHRVNSPYFPTAFAESIAEQCHYKEKSPVDLRAFAQTLFRYDPNCLLHGVFMSNLKDGRLRLARLLSGFIEAKNVRVAASGGVKFDRVDPTGDAKKGFGHVPFHRVEYTSDDIRAYFNLDLKRLRSYGLAKPAQDFLILLSVFKVQHFLEEGLRLRTACDFQATGSVRIVPKDFSWPDSSSLTKALSDKLAECSKSALFAQPAVTVV